MIKLTTKITMIYVMDLLNDSKKKGTYNIFVTDIFFFL